MDELTLNFKNQSVKFSTGNRVWEFKGIQTGAADVVQAEIMDRTLFQTAKGWALYICSKEDSGTTSLQGEMHPDLQALCKEYAEVFREVKGLPPKRSHEHQIPLIHGTEPVPWE